MGQTEEEEMEQEKHLEGDARASKRQKRTIAEGGRETLHSKLQFCGILRTLTNPTSSPKV